MAIQLKISINASHSVVTFNPNPLAANTLDQIFWVNNDPVNPHWPGKKNADGTIDKTFLMPNQIAPGGDVSATFSFATAQTLNYACSLHPNETGVINAS